MNTHIQTPQARRRTRLTTTAVGAVLVAALLGACGSGAASSSASGSSSDAATAAKKAKAELEVNYAGTDRELPTSSPKPPANKNIWIISCGQVVEGCSEGAQGATEAGKVLGWKTTIVDGKLQPQAWNQGIRQAIADKADGIILSVIDCGPIKASLDQARAAGIKIFGISSFDCTSDSASEKPRFDAETNYGKDYPEFKDWLRGFGATMATYQIAKTDGKARIIGFQQRDLKVVKEIVAGYYARLAECKSCEVLAKQEVTLADYGTALQQKTQTLLNRYPQANAVFGLNDSAMALGVSAAVTASGRADKLVVTGAEGFASNFALIRENKGQDFVAGYPAGWAGWNAMDGLNRLFAGEPQVDSGIGWRSADLDHNFPAKDVTYDGTKDYKSNFRKIWGVS